MGNRMLASWMLWIPVLLCFPFTCPGQSPAQPPSTLVPAAGAPILPSGTKNVTIPLEAIIIPFVFVIVASILGVSCVYIRGKRSKQSKPIADPDGRSMPGYSGVLKKLKASGGARCTFFDYQELENATQNFSPYAQIGIGGFGTVYKGSLNGALVAIKKSKHGGAQDVEQFVNEVAILSQVNHKNLVRLLGCCVDMQVPLLVYEFISNGTLQDHLEQARQGQPTELDWSIRLKIAIQTAEALEYLHVKANPPIFHRDVKSANILLDGSFNAKVADFGLSRLVEVDKTHVSTAVKGTPGYLDPEYFRNMQLTDKTDVFSFGVVLLELITAQKPVDSSSSQATHLSEVCVPLIRENRVQEIIDRTLYDSLTPEDFESIERVAKVAVACLALTRDRRPSMTQVLEKLNKVSASDLSADAFYQSDGLEGEHLPTAASFRKYLKLSSSVSGSLQAIELSGPRA